MIDRLIDLVQRTSEEYKTRNFKGTVLSRNASFDKIPMSI